MLPPIDGRYWRLPSVSPSEDVPKPSPSSAQHPDPTTPHTNPSTSPPKIAPKATPTDTKLLSAEAYTDQAVSDAQASKKVADKLEKPFDPKNPKHLNAQDDQADWTIYVARRKVANQDQSSAEQAIAAELRQTYKGDPKNKAATQNAAHGIAYRFHNDPTEQAAVNKALHTVLTETPAERQTNVKLNEVNRAGAKLDDLTSRQQNGGNVSGQQIRRARSAYQAKQKELETAVEKELNDKSSRLPLACTPKYDDPLAYTASQIAGRYSNDPELHVAVLAATIIHRVQSSGPQGNEAQMNVLGNALPKGVDPSVKGLVMSDSRMKNVANTYITNAANKVSDAYKHNGTVAGANALRDVTDPSKHSAVSLQIAAQIINKSKPTTDKIINDVGTLQVKGKDGRLMGGLNMTSGTNVAGALSQAVDVAAAGSDVAKKQYDTPEIKSAIEGMAHSIATHPSMNMNVYGFKDAVGHGCATLALATSAQIKNLKMSDVHMPKGLEFHDVGAFNKQRDIWEGATLGAIKDGISDLHNNAKKTSDDAMRGMAPLLVQGKYSGVMTDAQFNKGMKSLANQDSTLKNALIDGRKKIDAMGYRLLRTSEAVSFYGNELKDQNGYSDINQARDKMMSDKTDTSLMLLSQSASLRMGAQVARGLLASDLKNGKVDAPYYGMGAQAFGDLTEFLSETYVIKGVNMQYHADVQPGPGIKSVAINIPGEAIDVSRSAHLPFFGGVRIWGVGGGLQAALAGYIVNNVHIGGKTGGLRKGMLLGLVGGFAGFHLMQAGMAAMRINQHSFELPQKVGKLNLGKFGGTGISDAIDRRIAWIGSKIDKNAVGDASWGLYVKSGTARDQWTRLAVEATPGLIKQLVGLMSIATAWDASGVFLNATQLDGNKRNAFKLGTQGINLFNDSLLLRLQVREMSLRSLGKQVLNDSTLNAAFKARAAKEGVDLTKLSLQHRMRLAGTYSLGENSVGDGTLNGVRTYLGNSKFLNTFEGLFIKSGPAADELNPLLKKTLFRTIVGDSADETLAKLAVLGDNPIGWTVNILYMATNLANWGYDHNKNIQGYEKYDRSFLEGAGLDHAHADVMAQHHWWSGNAKVDGFLMGYAATGGDPNKFIDYINHMPTKTLDHALSLSEKMDDKLTKNGKVPATGQYDAYLALPADPSKADLKKMPNIHYNQDKMWYEDSVTGLHYDNKFHSWRDSSGKLGMGFQYYPDQAAAVYYWDTGHTTTNMNPTSVQGWKNWMTANGVPLPPVKPPLQPAPPKLPAAPPTPPAQNTYKVKNGDSVWGVAGNDLNMVEKIYQLNPWLNGNLEHGGSGQGRNPNLLHPGETLILPPA